MLVETNFFLFSYENRVVRLLGKGRLIRVVW